MISLPLTLMMLASAPLGSSGAPSLAVPPSAEGVRLIHSTQASRRLLLGALAMADQPPPPLNSPSDIAPSRDVFAFQETSQPSINISPWIPMGIGGALVVGGGVCWGLAKSIEGSLRGGQTQFGSVEELDQKVAQGKLLEKVGWGLGITGVLTVGITAAVVGLGPGRAGPSIPNFSVVPVQGGMVASVAGLIPG